MVHLRRSSDFALPAEAVTETFAILARRGVGKQTEENSATRWYKR